MVTYNSGLFDKEYFDSAADREPWMVIAEEQFDWIAGQLDLSRRENRAVILFSHEPPDYFLGL